MDMDGYGYEKLVFKIIYLFFFFLFTFCFLLTFMSHYLKKKNLHTVFRTKRKG